MDRPNLQNLDRRRRFLVLSILLSLLLLRNGDLRGADSLTPLQVAFAGSMGPLMDRGVKPAIAKSLNAELQGRAQGSSGLANLISAGSIRPDVFISVTPGPMRSVLKAKKAAKAIPIARTEMVIAYSPKSRFAAAFNECGDPRAEQWWAVLESRGLRFGRTDPNTDPQGLNIIFTMQLAAQYYNQPDLTDKVLGPQINPQQIFPEPQMMARLQAGQLDASSAYKSQPAALGLPFVSLPREINLGDAALEGRYRSATVVLNRKILHPSPLVFYAALLKDAPQPQLAAKFLAWLQTNEARELFARYYYDAPGDAQPLTP